eukprot:TRINITY_DN52927_c0_g1_i1.p1 TRINITY_DN52927_c0_g1~~TRINITY_DN52927_c0_g1_i1.p1  ORF type:complete len:112 (-),score=36.28 TRINITY_DN52927_c0_g1_i1:34-369(-)
MCIRDRPVTSSKTAAKGPPVASKEVVAAQTALGLAEQQVADAKSLGVSGALVLEAQQQVVEAKASLDKAWFQGNPVRPKPVPVVMEVFHDCLLYTSPSPRDRTRSRMPSSA